MEYRSYYSRSRNFDFDDNYFSRRDRSRDRSSDRASFRQNQYALPLRVTSVDVMAPENAVTNHTDMFHMTQRRPYSLIVRRGESFNIRLGFNRAFDEQQDEIGLILSTGRLPRAERRSEISIPVKTSKDTFGLDTKEWSAQLVSNMREQIEIKIQTELDAIIGCWTFTVVKLKDGAVRNDIYRYERDIFMLFNPYHYDGEVYVEDKQHLKEYFLRETGDIYMGSKMRQVEPRRWNFGQFQDEVLIGTMKALNTYWDDMRVRESDRSDPIQVSRTLTTIISLYVLRGNWTGDYSGGTNPSAWNGSVRILNEYLRTSNQVYFGQCWVFAGVLATMLRTLGIASRVVTNVSSAHDEDRDLCVDEKFEVDRRRALSKYDKPIDEERIWNFHVWTEAWMKRKDLKGQYGSQYDGWQVVDATAQERSEDCQHEVKEYKCGPMPVAALRESNLTVPYDGPFIYAEFNADYREMIYRRSQWGRLELISINVKHDLIGQGIFTSSPYGQQLNITDSYKPSEFDKEKEREGFEKAKKTLSMKTAGLTFRSPGVSRFRRSAPGRFLASSLMVGAAAAPPVQDVEEPAGDIIFEMTDLEEISIGDDIAWTLTMRNTGNERRSVKATSAAHVINFMGKEISECYAATNFITVPPQGVQKLLLDIPFETFEDQLGQEWYMNVSLFAVVQGTEQMFRGSDKFNVKQPQLKISTPEKVEVGTEGDLVISIVNPYKTRNLSNCEITLEGNGLALQTLVQISKTIAPGQELVVETSFGARYVGDTTLIANFSADELQNVHVCKDIEVVSR